MIIMMIRSKSLRISWLCSNQMLTNLFLQISLIKSANLKSVRLQKILNTAQTSISVKEKFLNRSNKRSSKRVITIERTQKTTTTETTTTDITTSQILTTLNGKKRILKKRKS